MSTVAEMAAKLSKRLVEVCQGQPADVIISAMLSGVVHIIRELPEEEQADLAVTFAIEMFASVADYPKRETLQ